MDFVLDIAEVGDLLIKQLKRRDFALGTLQKRVFLGLLVVMVLILIFIGLEERVLRRLVILEELLEALRRVFFPELGILLELLHIVLRLLVDVVHVQGDHVHDFSNIEVIA